MAAVFIETPDDFRRAVRIDETPESLFLEFKRDIGWHRGPTGREEQKEFCRDVTQFANALGGCLLVGIDEGPVGATRVVTAVRGIDDFDGRRAWMEQAIKNFVVPPSFRVSIHPIVLETKTVMSVNVRPSEKLVTLWDEQNGTIECVRRTNHGKVRMHPDEMEAHAMNTRRTAELMLRRAVGADLVRGKSVVLTSGVWTDNKRAMDPRGFERVHVQVELDELGEHELAIAIRPSALAVKPAEGRIYPSSMMRIPYGLLREAWRTVDGKISLFLHARVVYRDDDFFLEPF